MSLMPPPLDVLVSLRMEMQMGKSVASGLQSALSRRSDSFSKSLAGWQNRIHAGQDGREAAAPFTELTATAARRAFLALLERGLKGSPIDTHMTDLESEFYFAVEHEYERRLQLLPLKLLLPLTLFILPGVMILLIGPLMGLLNLE